MEVITKTYPENLKGRDFIIGDLHGMYSLLFEKLDGVGFDKTQDRLFSVGDLVDRGISSFRSSSLVEEDWFHCVRGNHEDMFLQWHKDRTLQLTRWYFGNGGDWVIDYEDDSLAFVAKRFESLPHVILIGEDNPVIISHAEFPFSSLKDFYATSEKYPERVIETLLWSRSTIGYQTKRIYSDIEQTYHGHTILEEIKQLGDAIFIDTGAYLQEDPYHLTLMEIGK